MLELAESGAEHLLREARDVVHETGVTPHTTGQQTMTGTLHFESKSVRAARVRSIISKSSSRPWRRSGRRERGGGCTTVSLTDIRLPPWLADTDDAAGAWLTLATSWPRCRADGERAGHARARRGRRAARVRQRRETTGYRGDSRRRQDRGGGSARHHRSRAGLRPERDSPLCLGARAAHREALRGRRCRSRLAAQVRRRPPRTAARSRRRTRQRALDP